MVILDLRLLFFVLSKPLRSENLTISINCDFQFQFKMDVYLSVQRKKQTIYLDPNYYMLVDELKTMIGCIIKVIPSSIQLYYEGKIMDGTKTLYDCGLNSFTANVMRPATIGLTLKMDNGEFEPLKIVPYSWP